MAKFFHVSIGFEDQPLSVDAVQKSFGSAGWARYAPNCWIISTVESASSIAEKLRKICNKQDSIFVCELDIKNNAGYLHKEIWDWIGNERAR